MIDFNLIPFIGKEIEGPEQGVLTLFIPNGFVKNIGEVKAFAIIQKTKIYRLYFGAGNKQGLDIDDIKLIKKLIYNNYQILAEINNLKNLDWISSNVLSKIEIIYCIYIHTKIDHIKIINDSFLEWGQINGDWFTTSLTDKEYQNDTKIQI